MKVGLIGHRGAGKTTIFNMLTGLQAQVGGFAGKEEVHLGVIKVPDARIDWIRLGCVIFTLALAVAINVVVNVRSPARADAFPFLGTAVWGALLLTTPLRRPEWRLLPGAARGALFLIALVASASLMPVQALPAASWPTALGLGFVSSIFDNIPLTKLALETSDIAKVTGRVAARATRS